MTEAPGLQRPPDYEVMEFAVEDERWSEYELADGVRIRARIFLVRIHRRKDAKPGEYDFQFNQVFTVIAPPHMRGPASTPPPPDKVSADQMYPVRVLTYNEPWNVYRVVKTGDIIKLKMVVSEVYRVRDIYDQNGEPYYIVIWGPTVAPGKPVTPYKP